MSISAGQDQHAAAADRQATERHTDGAVTASSDRAGRRVEQCPPPPFSVVARDLS